MFSQASVYPREGGLPWDGGLLWSWICLRKGSAFGGGGVGSASPLSYGQLAVSTHPTGMHS